MFSEENILCLSFHSFVIILVASPCDNMFCDNFCYVWRIFINIYLGVGTGRFGSAQVLGIPDTLLEGAGF